MCNIHVIKSKTDFWEQDNAKIFQTTTEILVVLSDVKLENTNLHLYNQGVKGFLVSYSESIFSQ